MASRFAVSCKWHHTLVADSHPRITFSRRSLFYVKEYSIQKDKEVSSALKTLSHVIESSLSIHPGENRHLAPSWGKVQ